MNPAEQYILKQQEPFKSILFQLQIVIESEYPEVDLKYKWKIPYYYLHEKPFCFLNVTKGYVDVGFWMPYSIPAFEDYLISDNRKVMKSLRYFTMEDIDQMVLVGILKEIYKHYQKGFRK